MTYTIVLLPILLLLIVYCVRGLRRDLQTTEYIYTSEKLQQEFDGFRILQISDYHNKDFGDNQRAFIDAVYMAEPDVIVLTGDVIDRKHPNISAAREMISGISRIAPVYFITGNHELEQGAESLYAQLIETLRDNGVAEMDNCKAVITAGEARITVYGVRYLGKYIERLPSPDDTGDFNVLLYHGSGEFKTIAPLGYDLVFSGHGHGGVIRLPFIGGLFGNDGELLPKYGGGMFTLGGSTLISSRGIGDAALPRFRNAPELVVVILRHMT